MKNIRTLTPGLFLLTLLVLPALLLASSTSPSAKAGSKEGISPSEVTAHALLTVRKVETEPNRLYLYDADAEKTHVVVLTEKTRLTARRKKDFDGRRKLVFGDLAAGQTLKVTYRTDDGRITSIQVLEKAS